MKVLNLGSLNIDRVLAVDHVARAGETIASRSLREFAGGKGANQSVALARAQAPVTHLGKVGVDGAWLLEKLTAEGVDTRHVHTTTGPTGQAMIQVDAAGENAIVLVAGANFEITPGEVDAALAECQARDWLLVQNETGAVAHAIRAAHARGLRVAFNPAPCDERVRAYPLELVDVLCVNESEGAALSGHSDPDAILEALSASLPACDIILTLGAAGAIQRGPAGILRCPAPRVAAVDTTAAGDTFFGYYLASRLRDEAPLASLELACRAAALCVTRSGAMDSIPRLNDVLNAG